MATGERSRKHRRGHEKSEEEDSKRYLVEKILEMKEGPGDDGQLFRENWQGYPVEQATWEPKLNLQRTMVAEFLTQ